MKHWFTLNEPYTYSYFGYGTGTMAPGRCSNYVGTCTEGDSSTEPYIVTHHLILAHGAAVKLYREKYKVDTSKRVVRLKQKNSYNILSK